MKKQVVDTKIKPFIFSGEITAIKEKRTADKYPGHNFTYWPFISFYEFVTYSVN